MRWITMPAVAAIISCALWVAPVSARVEKTSKTPVTAKAAHAGKRVVTAKATKTTSTAKASQKAAAAQSAKKPANAKVINAKVAKASKTAKSAKLQKTLKARQPVSSKKNRGGKRLVAATPVIDEAAELQSVAAIDPNDKASERVYDGMLPTVEEKIIMPVVKDENGRAECVQLIKSLMDAPRTMFWKEGRKLKASWDKIQPGTAIATFIKGRYPQQGKGRGNKHAAIFLRATAAGIYVFDQFAGQADAEERFIPWHHPRDKRLSNNATAFSTVRW